MLSGGVIKLEGTEVSTGMEIESGGVLPGGMFEFIKVCANPNDGQFKVQFATDKKRDVEMQVIDGTGRILSFQRIESSLPGIHTVSMDVRNLAKGNYFVRLISEGSVLSKPVVIN